MFSLINETFSRGWGRSRSSPSWSAFWLQKPSILRVCVREEDAREREAGVQSTTPTYTAGKDSPARESSWSAFWLQKPSILRVCVREEDAREREAGVHSTTPTYTAVNPVLLTQGAPFSHIFLLTFKYLVLPLSPYEVGLFQRFFSLAI